MGEKFIWVATGNQMKEKEFRNFFGERGWEVKTLSALKQPIQIEETGQTFEENALIKARKLSKVINLPCIGEDRGMCIQALNGWPGLYSKRWKKEKFKFSDFRANEIILEVMSNLKNRTVYFVSALALVDPVRKIEKTFVCRQEGLITEKINNSNNDDYGYDPIFYLPNLGKTYSQMNEEERLNYDYCLINLKKLYNWLEKNGK